ncbi:MAG: KTSC domain-containing protein [Chitinophagales bacterium]|nr:KTSC domain-containing protein [Chitinophagales bacterium]
MKVAVHFFTINLVIILFSCSSKTNCEEIPAEFSSYKEAGKEIKSANFKFSETINTSKSSWITSASYYSCDGDTGYFQFTTNGKVYTHIGVPYSLWIDFKKAASYGNFYNKYLKHKYQLNLKN